MNVQLIGTFIMLVAMPVLVIEVRILLYARWRQHGDDRRQFLEILIEELPHDLAVIGISLGMASYVLSIPAEIKTGPFASTYFKLAFVGWIIPFVLMSTIPILRSKKVRLAIGILAYGFGAMALIATQHILGG